MLQIQHNSLARQTTRPARQQRSCTFHERTSSRQRSIYRSAQAAALQGQSASQQLNVVITGGTKGELMLSTTSALSTPENA
jgi:hypothetical protein